MLKLISDFNISIFSNRMVVINIDAQNNYLYYGTDNIIYNNEILQNYLIKNNIYYKFYNIILIYNNNTYETLHEYNLLHANIDKKWYCIDRYETCNNPDNDLKSIDSDDSVIIDSHFAFNMIILILNKITNQKLYFGSSFIIYNSKLAYKILEKKHFDTGFKCFFYIKSKVNSYYLAYTVNTYNNKNIYF
jgi:hypothetical protein